MAKKVFTSGYSVEVWETCPDGQNEELALQADFVPPEESSWFQEHHLTVTPFWENCGAVGTRIECSCGFYDEEFSGGGCWQHGHQEPREFQALGPGLVHAQLIRDAALFAKRQGIGCPAEVERFLDYAQKGYEQHASSPDDCEVPYLYK